jgi:hypothetical protein
MQLPAALQAWSDWLNWFGEDQATQMGDLVFRLSPLLGRFRGANRGNVEEPDGLGDLHRRGSYERLLSSEWLIAEEIPEEFLRRAVTGEHLFLAPRPRATQGQKLILALFDAGPLQLGAARLVQVALWILLARRARELGGTFCWGILQDAPALFAADDPASLRSLLRARGFQPAEAGHAERWQVFLAANKVMPGEFWLVSPERDEWLHQLSHLSHQLVALPDLAGDGVDISIHEGQTVRRSVLALPPARLAQRILKGEFQPGDQPVAPQQHVSKLRLSIARPPVLTLNGSHVAIPMLDDAGMMVFQIPKKAVHRPGKPRQQQWPGGFKPLAIVNSGRALLALLSGKESLQFHQFDQRGGFPRPPREEFEAPPGQAAYLPAACVNTLTGLRFYVIDRARRLKFWTRVPAGVQADLQMAEFASGVHVLAQISQEELVFVSEEAGRLKVSRLGKRNIVEWLCWLPNPQPPTEVLLAASRLWSTGFGTCAIRCDNESAQRWIVYVRDVDNSENFRTHELLLPEGWRAIGLVQQADSLACGVLAVNRSRDQVHLFSDSQSVVIHTGAAWITRYAVCPLSGLVALLTNAYQLLVYDVPTRQLRLSMDIRGEADAG